MINKLYEDNALGNIGPDRYQQLSQKYSTEYYSLKEEISARGEMEVRNRLGALDRSLNVWLMSVFFARQGKFSKE